LIRPAAAADATWVRDLGVEVYGYLGDYRHIIPAWIAHPAVETWLAVDDTSGERQGFIIVGIYRAEDLAPGKYIADLLAIAVAPTWQDRGLGRVLLAHALGVARRAQIEVPIAELRLTVADTNARARHLFDTTGFEILDAAHGHYAGGQIAIRMRHRLGAG
jgi:ribosomal protein S18 acetylase RimI-like enzyme